MLRNRRKISTVAKPSNEGDVVVDDQSVETTTTTTTTTTTVPSENDNQIEGGDDSKLEKSKSRRRKPHIEIEYEDENEDEDEDEDDDKPTISSSSRKSTKKNPPEKWKEIWNGIVKMREGNDAPVDSMGCEIDKDPNVTDAVHRFRLLISLMLSSQTTDKCTRQGLDNLIAKGLTVNTLLEMDDEEIDECIKMVGFHNKKVDYLKRTAKILKEKYNSDIPRKFSDVLALPGVGPKMGHLLMQFAWNDIQGIGVDVHVHRISNRLGWVKDTKTPEATRKGLEEWLPFEYWPKINRLIVGFGQTVCTPINPKCSTCLVKDICPSSRKLMAEKTKKAKTKAKGKGKGKGEKKG